MEGHYQQEFRLSSAQNPHPPEGYLAEVEGPLCYLTDQSMDLSLPRPNFEFLQNDHAQSDRLRGSDQLVGDPTVDMEARPQNLVATDGRREALLQHRHIQLPDDSQHGRDVVKGVSRDELIQEPEPF